MPEIGAWKLWTAAGAVAAIAVGLERGPVAFLAVVAVWLVFSALFKIDVFGK